MVPSGPEAPARISPKWGSYFYLAFNYRVWIPGAGRAGHSGKPVAPGRAGEGSAGRGHVTHTPTFPPWVLCTLAWRGHMLTADKAPRW